MNEDDPIPAFLRVPPRLEEQRDVRASTPVVLGLVFLAGIGAAAAAYTVVRQEVKPAMASTAHEQRIADAFRDPEVQKVAHRMPEVTFADVPIYVRPEPAYRPELDVGRRVALKLVQQGMGALREGRVSAARYMFEMAAKDGEPFAAVGMAQTYDPAINRMYGTQLRGSGDRMRTWYEKADVLFEARRLRTVEAAAR